MLHKHSRSLALLLGLCVACGGDDDTEDADGSVQSDGGNRADAGDAGRTDGGIDAGTGDVLQSGTYNVSSVSRLSDGCGLKLESGFTTLEVLNTDGLTISMGRKFTASTDPAWTPEGYALGSGPWLTARTTTLMAAARNKFTEANVTCEFDVQRTTKLVYTAPNTVTVDYTDVESNPSSGCASLNVTSNCTSQYTFTLSKPVTP